jgi:two-component system LytT family sensor kinase
MMDISTQNIFKKIKITGLHLSVWSLLFILNYLFIKNYRVSFDLPFHLITWLIYILLFYLNYYLLMPVFLFRKSIIIYIIATLCLLAGSYYIKDYFTKKHFDKIFAELKENMPPIPDFERMNPISNPALNHEMNIPPKPEGDKLGVLKPGRVKPGEKPGGRSLFNLRRPGGERKMFLAYGLLLIYASSLSIRFIQKWRDDDKRKSEIEKEKILTELSYLKQQINPHFLFNSLNSIYSLTISKSKTATDAILKLSSILRYILYESENTLVNLNDELNIINDYIELQKLRLNKKVNVSLNIASDPESYKIEPFILMPLVENAFKFGVDNITDSFIDINISILNKKLEFHIKNKKVFTRDNEKQDSGIGIRNVIRRLDLLYPDEYNFRIEDSKNIFSVFLEIKLKR